MAETCPLCRQRKGKRACPAKGAAICSHCCGAKRRVEIDCPPNCVYLGGGPSTSWEGRESERRRDALRVAPHLQGLTEDQARLFFLALVGIGGIRAARRELDDRLLAQAVSALRKTVETRTRGLLYEHAPEDLRAQGVLLDLRDLFEAKDEQGRTAAPDDRDLLPVLAALEASLSGTLAEGDGSRAFLDTVARLVARQGRSRSSPRPLILAPGPAAGLVERAE